MTAKPKPVFRPRDGAPNEFIQQLAADRVHLRGQVHAIRADAGIYGESCDSWTADRQTVKRMRDADFASDLNARRRAAERPHYSDLEITFMSCAKRRALGLRKR
jgi:hypothetical protein